MTSQRDHSSKEGSFGMNTIAHHLRSNALAYVALFIALTSTSYAAITIPNNSVGNKQLKKDAVDAKKVKNKTLLAEDFKAGLPVGAQGLPGAPGGQGQQGEQGPKGDKGDKGDKGIAGVPAGTLAPSQSVTLDPADIAMTGADQVVLTAPALVTTATSRIHAAALSTALVSSGAGGMDCVVKINSNGGGAVVMGQRVFFQPPISLTAPMPASGTTAPLAAGSHVVTFECKGNASSTFQRGDLYVVAGAP